MKRLLIGVLAFIPLISNANSYYTQDIKCQISGEETSISNPQVRYLPNKIEQNFRITRIDGSNKPVHIGYDSDDFSVPKVGYPEGVKYHSQLFVETGLLFPKLNSRKSKILLEKLGAESVPVLKKGFKFKPIFVYDKIDVYFQVWMAKPSSDTAQLHFKPTKHNGLSYHVTVSCEET
ncbi:MAG: hypothetical protein ACOYL6_14300 [Bacteriovoracaceae bacterium]